MWETRFNSSFVLQISYEILANNRISIVGTAEKRTRKYEIKLILFALEGGVRASRF